MRRKGSIDQLIVFFPVLFFIIIIMGLLMIITGGAKAINSLGEDSSFLVNGLSFERESILFKEVDFEGEKLLIIDSLIRGISYEEDYQKAFDKLERGFFESLEEEEETREEVRKKVNYLSRVKDAVAEELAVQNQFLFSGETSCLLIMQDPKALGSIDWLGDFEANKENLFMAFENGDLIHNAYSVKDTRFAVFDFESLEDLGLILEIDFKIVEEESTKGMNWRYYYGLC